MVIEEVILGIKSVVCFLCLEAVVLLLSKYRKEKQSIFREQEDTTTLFFQHKLKHLNMKIHWAAFFFGLFLIFLIFILGDFFVDAEEREIYLKIAYSLYILTLFVLMGNLDYKKLRYAYLFFFFISLFLHGAQLHIFRRYIIVISVLAFLMGIYFIYRLWTKLKGVKISAIPYIGLLVSLFALWFGFILTTDYSIVQFGQVGQLVGTLIEFLSMIFLSIAISFLPSFTEYDWSNQIKQIFVLTSAGINIYEKSFDSERKMTTNDVDLASSAILAVKDMIETMLKNGKTLETIEKKHSTITLCYGKKVILVIITEEKSLLIKEKGETFVKLFEKRFENQLKEFSGNINGFKSADELVISLFPSSDIISF